MKKTIKNIFGLILITIMILSVSVANADNNFGISLFSGTSSSDSNSIPGTSDLYYSFEDGVLSIYGSGKVPASLSATWTSSKTVKFNPGGVTEIIIEEGITGINERLTRPFKNNTISVTLPSSLEYIAESTFNNYTKLETVTIPDNSKLKYIYTSAFEKCTALKNILALYLSFITLP